MLKITIEGAAATGKSAFAFAIRQLCLEKDIPVEIIGCEDEKPGVMEEEWGERLSSIKHPVLIETVRT